MTQEDNFIWLSLQDRLLVSLVLAKVHLLQKNDSR